MGREVFAAALALAVLALCRPGAAIEPPIVKVRDIAGLSHTPPGFSRAFDTSTTLFLPEGWKDQITSAGQVRLTVHFHSAMWYAIQEHLRRGAAHPILALYLGEGSSVYRRPFEDPAHLGALIEQARAVMIEQGAPKNLEIAPIELQSFSAGYGAIREILKSPEYLKKITSVVLADSCYSNLTTASRRVSTDSGTTTIIERHADDEQMKPFTDFALRAAHGEVEMLAAHTTIFTGSYASTVETADLMIEAVGGRRENVTSGSLAAADPGLSFPLTARFDKGRLHIWQYDGNVAQAHIAVARTIADFWKALESERAAVRKPD